MTRVQMPEDSFGSEVLTKLEESLTGTIREVGAQLKDYRDNIS